MIASRRRADPAALLQRPGRLEPGPLRLGHPTLGEVDGLVSTSAESAPFVGARTGRAESYDIGWFDLFGPPEERRGGTTGTDNERMEPGVLALRLRSLLRRLAAALQPPLEALYSPGGVLDWPAPLLPFQREGVAALLGRREILLADDMGLGKTVQAIAAARILLHRGQIASALVVCPASLLHQWRSEWTRWAPDLAVTTVYGEASARSALWRLPGHVKMVSYETLRADVLDLPHSPVVRGKWGLVILDEASRIKNRETGVAVAVKRVPRERRWALTGTPVENRVDDLLSLLEFLRGEAGDPPRSWTTAGLRSGLRSLQLRRRKQDVLTDLPEKQIIPVELDLDPEQRAAYDLAERDGVIRLKEAGAAITITHVLELIVRLKQICNGDPVSGRSAKLDDIAERLDVLVAEGHRALVFSQFTDEDFGTAGVARRLRTFDPLEYTGRLSPADRDAVVRRFQNETRHKALILSLRAGGVGLNLQAASYVFHLDRWWNPAIEDQADSRSHRMGQPFPVTVVRYVCRNTIEERIDAALRRKRQIFEELVDDVSLDLRKTLSESEIFHLFGLEKPRIGGPSEPPEGRKSNQ